MVGALEFSSDPTIKECLTLYKDPEFSKRLTEKQKAEETLYQHQAEYWNSSLTPQEVQSKFKDIVLLEPQS